MHQQHIPTYTVSQRQLWKDDWELIQGHPYAMSPSSTGRHQRRARSLMREIEKQLDTCRECEIYYELDWIVDEQTVVRPDLFICCGALIEEYLREAPSLIIEILSPSTRLKDMNVKNALYASMGVRYYIMAESDSDEMTMLHLVDGNYEPMDSTTIDICDGCSVDLS